MRPRTGGLAAFDEGVRGGRFRERERAIDEHLEIVPAATSSTCASDHLVARVRTIISAPRNTPVIDWFPTPSAAHVERLLVRGRRCRP